MSVLQDQYRSIAALASLDPQGFKLVENLPEKPGEGTVSLVVSGVEIYLPLADLVDVETERARLQKELSEIQSQIDRLEKLLGSDFANKAPRCGGRKRTPETGHLPGNCQENPQPGQQPGLKI